MKKFCITLWAAAVVLNSACALAQTDSIEPIDDKDVAEINALTEPEPSSSELVEEAIENYFSKKGVIEGVIGKGGKVFYSAVVRASVGPDNPSWTKARQIAFEKAYLKAQSEYVFNNFGRNIVETEREYFRNDSSNAEEFKDEPISRSRIEAIFLKAMALGEATLDNLLKDAGVDPSTYDSVPEAERKKLFVDNYITHSIQSAMGKSSGLLPIQTFVGEDSKGNHSIGVVVIRSDKLQQLASDMSLQKQPFLTAKKGKSLDNFINFSGEDLASQFGVRVVFDPEGKPMVLSFGQWGFGYGSKNDRRLERDREHAAAKADTVAIDALTTFMNSRLTYSNESTSGEIISESLLKQGEQITEERISETIDLLNRKIELTASAKLNGSRVVKRWKYKHPFGHEIVGRVRMWSFDAVVQSKSIKNFKPKKNQPSKKEVVKKNTNGSGSVKSGPSFDDEEEAF